MVARVTPGHRLRRSDVVTEILMLNAREVIQRTKAMNLRGEIVPPDQMLAFALAEAVISNASSTKTLHDALFEARESLLVILSPAIDAQLPSDRRQRGHNAIDTAATALQETGYLRG